MYQLLMWQLLRQCTVRSYCLLTYYAFIFTFMLASYAAVLMKSTYYAQKTGP